jgi:L-threonylcarbamoyladenylate synthase
VRRLYELKGRPPDKPAAVMFFALEPALAALPEIGADTRRLLERLLPGGVTVLLPKSA